MASSSVEFVDVSMVRKSEVWKHFLYNKEVNKAKCGICSLVLVANGTRSLISHLQSKHQVLIKRCMGSSADEVVDKRARFEGNFEEHANKESLGEVISRLVSVDNLNFHQIANSDLIRRSFSRDGYDIPKSPHSIKDIFINEYRRTLSCLTLKIDLWEQGFQSVSMSQRLRAIGVM